MLFVPLPLFATLMLILLLGRFITARDMAVRAHQLFACLLGLYALQSLLASLRWGYEVQGAGFYVALLAPVLPVVAYLAYTALTGRQTGKHLWPLLTILVNWVAFLSVPALADPLILITYLGFGGLLLRLCCLGVDKLPLSPINDAREIIIALCLTGVALVASGLTDVYLIFDFVKNDGRNAATIVTFAQTAFVLVIGASAVFGRSSEYAEVEPEEPETPAAVAPEATDQDSDIVDRLEALFERDGLHRMEDLSLRRLSRRLHLPDRQVSNAINRVTDKSVSQFVNDFRIKEACTLLSTTKQSVLEVSQSAGFASKSNFNREFSRVTGETPSRWRKQHSH